MLGATSLLIRRASVTSAGAMACLAIAVCFGQTRAIPTDPAKLLIVDCLLPGQLKRLGGRMTYLTPQRPVRASASECEIRGGEYVAYDRANYETALAFWLPQAESGDPAAQNYVGEIYEKGLGREPDYAVAAEWYRKASDQGFRRAQLSLAYLYEQGLGVDRDPVAALNLYRRATGIKDDDLTYVSEVTAARSEAQRVIDSLTAQLESRSKALDGLQAELAYTQNRLTDRRSDLEATEARVTQLETEIDALRAGGSAAREAELAKLEQELRTREESLAWRQREVAELEATSADQRAQMVENLRDAADREAALRERLDDQSGETAGLTEELAEARQQLYATQQKLADATAALAAERQQLAAERERMMQASGAASEQRQGALDEAEDRLRDQQQQIAALEAEQRRHIETIATLRSRERDRPAARQADDVELRSTHAQLARAQQRLLETEQQVDDLTTQLRAERERLSLEREQLERREALAASKQQSQIDDLYRELAGREAELAKQETLIGTLKDESRQYLEQIAKLRSQGGETLAMRSIGASPSQMQVVPDRRSVKDFDLGKYHALIIGNDSYANLPPLSSAINDAQALDEVLRRKYGFETKLLLNATRAEILGALNEYRESLTDHDSLLIYYAGHGELDRRNLRGYWLPVNAKRDDTTEWISDQMVTDQIALMAARHVMVIADSCYSGVMTRNSGMRLVATGGAEAELKRLRRLAQLPSRIVLTSGGEQPVLDGGGGGMHSIFARYLIETLESNDRILESSALYDGIFDPVKQAAAKFSVEQAPRFSILADAGHLNGEFLFVPAT
jgi:TPR repeat protein